MFKVHAKYFSENGNPLVQLTIELETNGLFRVEYRDYRYDTRHTYQILPSLRFDLQLYKEFFKA